MPAVLRSLPVFLAWLLAAGAVLATLGPLDWRPSFGHPDLERFGAYAVLAVVFGLAYSNHRRWAWWRWCSPPVFWKRVSSSRHTATPGCMMRR